MLLVSVDAREIAEGVRGKWNEIEDGISTIAPRGKTSFPLTFQEEGVWGALRVGSREVNRSQTPDDEKLFAKRRVPMAKVVPPAQAIFGLDFGSKKFLIPNPTLPQLFSGAHLVRHISLVWGEIDIQMFAAGRQNVSIFHTACLGWDGGTLDRLLTRSPRKRWKSSGAGEWKENDETRCRFPARLEAKEAEKLNRAYLQ